MSAHDEPDSQNSSEDLTDFERRLRDARAKAGLDRDAEDEGPPLNRSAAWRASTDLVAAVLVGAVLGWLIDAVAGTGPWVMVAGLFFGFAAGVRNAFRTARDMNEQG